jgi:hypothetical protein
MALFVLNSPVYQKRIFFQFSSNKNKLCDKIIDILKKSKCDREKITLSSYQEMFFPFVEVKECNEVFPIQSILEIDFVDDFFVQFLFLVFEPLDIPVLLVVFGVEEC